MNKDLIQIHQKPDLHFSICSNNKELFSKFEQALKKNGLIGLPDLQGNLHYIVDGRKGFPTAYKNMKTVTMQLMESRFNLQNQKTEKLEKTADFLIDKYEFDKSLIGTKFIHQIIIHCLLDKSLLVSFSNNLYPLIAEIFQSDPNKVCYSVRYAFRKLEAKEKKERLKNINKTYFFDENIKTRGNRSTIYKLINEAENLVEDLKEFKEIKKSLKKEKGYQ
ncbi:MAG: hypothetical protein GX909_03960 [Clostridiaceae bacterium]|nr:hypothetical protein [Clostridiaceae bacterium]